jgi:hypothetical protein
MFLKAGKYMSMDKGPMADKMPSIKIIFVRFAEVSIIEGVFLEEAKVRLIILN